MYVVLCRVCRICRGTQDVADVGGAWGSDNWLRAEGAAAAVVGALSKLVNLTSLSLGGRWNVEWVVLCAARARARACVCVCVCVCELWLSW